MMPSLFDPDLGLLITTGSAGLLCSAAVHKGRAPREFERVLAAYRLLPGPAVPVAARLVPSLEIALAAALLIPATRAPAAAAAAGLWLLYAAAMAVNLARGRVAVDCGCGRPGERRRIAPWMVVRNLLLSAALAGACAPWTARPLGVIDVLSVAGGLVVVSLLYVTIERLLGEIAPRRALPGSIS